MNVIALVGERGREVREFVERDLGPEGLARSRASCVATSDQPALLRVKCAETAMTHRRGVPRPGPRRAAADGLGDALRHGAARDRPGGRRAAGHAAATRRASSRRCRGCSSAPARGTSGSITGADHGARRGRRHERAGRRRRPRHPRRPRRARPRASRTATTTRRSTCCSRSRASRPVDPDARRPRGRRAPARGARDVPREGGPDRDRRLPARVRPEDRLRDRHVDPLEAFLRQGADEPEQPEIAERRLATMLGL